ncbi:MAG: radical SAM protein [Desulfohalobiaceae bacterium]|nr:radical SAM protein [Desulfohalobiaceae bacterium]
MVRKIYFLCLNPIQFVPFAYGTLRSYAEKNPCVRENYQWIPPIWRFEPIQDILERIAEPSVLCASCYVWNHNHHLALAREVKRTYPGCRVVFGGPHVPAESASYFHEHPFVDVLVHNEGELALEALLVEFIQENPDIKKISGISINQDGFALQTGKDPVLPKELPIPSPYLQGMFEPFFAESSQARIALWETNRGCPYSCSFCDWGVRTMNRLRLHSFDKAAREIEYLARKQIQDIYITDCNFGIFERDVELARLLVRAKKTYGYPQRVRIQFAKTSNDNVFEISRMLHENAMLWGTTLSMQSVDLDVLQAVNRKQIGIRHYQELKKRYDQQGIPTYTELILGLPTETRHTFVNGICSLFEIGIHDDVRVFELTLLPNAPLSRPENREKFGIKTGMRPMRLVSPGQVREEVELVFETAAMPAADMAYCLLFAETVQALHNGGFTRFLSRYLHQEHGVSFRTFYEGLLNTALESGKTCFKGLQRVRRLIFDFYRDPDMPQIHRLLTQPDMMAFLCGYNPKRKAWQIWTYLWLWIAEHADDFYESLAEFLVDANISRDPAIRDLLAYQKELMISLDFDPDQGKRVGYAHNWFGYFFLGEKLDKREEHLLYADRFMGVSNRFALKGNDHLAFTRAAIGISYPYSKHRHFFHQPESTRRLLPGDIKE